MTTKQNAFRGTYSDFKLIKTRKCIQIIIEVPLEQADLAYQVLGGMPNPAAETWLAVARLSPHSQSDGSAPRVEHQSAPLSRGAQRSWNDLSLPEQAGILCDDAAFCRFLAEKTGSSVSSDKAAAIVREHCIVKSRADIKDNHSSGWLWCELVAEYRTWKIKDQVVG